MALGHPGLILAQRILLEGARGPLLFLGTIFGPFKGIPKGHTRFGGDYLETQQRAGCEPLHRKSDSLQKSSFRIRDHEPRMGTPGSWLLERSYGRGSTPVKSHFGIGAPPIGVRGLTHSHVVKGGTHTILPKRVLGLQRKRNVSCP